MKINIVLGRSIPITIEEIGLLSTQRATVSLNDDSKFVKRITDGPKLVEQLINDGHAIYGVNTGYGANCTTSITKDELLNMASQILPFLGCGLGPPFDLEQTRATLAARILSLARGQSGVRIELLDQLTKLLQFDVLPRIPQEGSVGASGDLVPLSYVAAVLTGTREVYYNGQLQPTQMAFNEVGMVPLKLGPKEGLALLNGTSVMTGVACLAWLRAKYISKLASRISSLAVLVLNGNLYHYDQTLFEMKPHPGQQLVASRIRKDLIIDTILGEKSNKETPIQDRYSIRCAPHVIGVLEDALPFFKNIIEIELNSVNDNPLFDVDTGRVFHGGMFYGGHIAFAMDSLKCQVANLADLMDRQMALMTNSLYNRGLPSMLSGAVGSKACIHHGLKALEISTSAWTAEALKHTIPASIFSRSTENHNQDKVSMGTIAARDCVRVLELTEQVAAALLVAVRQGLALRERESRTLMSDRLSKEGNEFVECLKTNIEFIDDDVELESTLRSLTSNIRNRTWRLYEEVRIQNGV